MSDQVIAAIISGLAAIIAAVISALITNHSSRTRRKATSQTLHIWFPFLTGLIIGILLFALLSTTLGKKEGIRSLPASLSEQKTPSPYWPVSETGVESCHITFGSYVHAGEEARLWPEPDVTTGIGTFTTLLPNSMIKVNGSPIWGKIRANPDYYGWWWPVEFDGKQGWLWQSRIVECDST